MPAHAIIGAQWGDEGKGKLVDYISSAYDVVTRFQGGNNAGHTVKVGSKTYKLHLLPSGAVRGRPVVIGNGVVVDPKVLLKEMDDLAVAGRKVRLSLSDRAHVILPYHILLDGALEAGARRKIGTTKRGIGPCYADKARRVGIRMGDFVDPRKFRRRLTEVLPAKRKELAAAGVKRAPTLEAIVAEYGPLAKRLRPFVKDVGDDLARRLGRGQHVLFEGAQGVLLDIDHGTYPFVTSSNTVASNAAAGAGVGPHHVQAVLGVAKAYLTRVGEGPFPTEVSSREGVGHHLLTVGREFGTTTGRPRRVGWIDLVALRYAVRVGGITHLALTKLDILDGVTHLRACTAYRIRGKRVKTFPADVDDLAAAKPVYATVPGWLQSGRRVGRGWRLAAKAKAYVRFLEEQLGVPVVFVSVGPGRDETLAVRDHPFGA